MRVPGVSLSLRVPIIADSVDATLSALLILYFSSLPRALFAVFTHSLGVVVSLRRVRTRTCKTEIVLELCQDSQAWDQCDLVAVRIDCQRVVASSSQVAFRLQLCKECPGPRGEQAAL